MNIFERDSAVIAPTYARFPVAIASGSGSLLYDENGKRYIDMGSGIGVTAFGHADHEWVAAVTDQLLRVSHTSNLYYTEPCVRLAELLTERTGLSRVFFSNSGAEANECAIKAARKYAQTKYGDDRYAIITLESSFHGRTLTTLAATGQAHYHELFTPLTPGFYSGSATDLDALKTLCKEKNAAAVMIECIRGEGGVLPLDREFAKGLSEFCRSEDILLIVVEVQTGNGRTGALYCYMNYGIQPDIVTTAKGLGGGLPIGATLLGEKVKDVFSYGDHGSTFGGNPAAAAGAVSIISRIDDLLLSEVRRKSELVFDRLSGKKGITGVSGMGLMLGISTVRAAKDIVREALDAGVLCLTAKDKVRLLPALNIPDGLLTEALDVICTIAAKDL